MSETIANKNNAKQEILASLRFIYDHLKEGKTITKLEDNFESTFNTIQKQIRENLLVNISKVHKNESLLSALVDFANKIMEVRVAQNHQNIQQKIITKR